MTVFRSTRSIHGAAALLLAALATTVTAAWSQQPAGKPTADSTPSLSAAPVGPKVVLAPAAQASTSNAAPPAASTPARSAVPQAPRRSAIDRVQLDASQITGNRELPRVLYIVPWLAPSPGDLEGKPVNSLLYELTRPVDREVFRRENRYFDALQGPPESAAGAAATRREPGPDAPKAAPPALAPASRAGTPEK